jgi:AraC family transcriptional regulator of adaptative response/methylated-DNA-[protein]-cysteine methyltransferase
MRKSKRGGAVRALRIKEATEAVTTLQTREDPRWARVLARDSTADGQFYYSVVTTGVYCLPSCGSRHARPEM